MIKTKMAFLESRLFSSQSELLEDLSDCSDSGPAAGDHSGLGPNPSAAGVRGKPLKKMCNFEVKIYLVFLYFLIGFLLFYSEVSVELNCTNGLPLILFSILCSYSLFT